MKILSGRRPRALRVLRPALTILSLLVGALVALLGAAGSASANTPCQSDCSYGFSTSVSTESATVSFSTTTATTAYLFVYDSHGATVRYVNDTSSAYSHTMTATGLHPNNNYTYTTYAYDSARKRQSTQRSVHHEPRAGSR